MTLLHIIAIWVCGATLGVGGVLLVSLTIQWLREELAIRCLQRELDEWGDPLYERQRVGIR